MRHQRWKPKQVTRVEFAANALADAYEVQYTDIPQFAQLMWIAGGVMRELGLTEDERNQAIRLAERMVPHQ